MTSNVFNTSSSSMNMNMNMNVNMNMAMAMNMAGASSLNPNDYDPISSLEKQYAGSPGLLGRRLTIVLKVNDACIVPGGVDTVIKNGKSKKLTRTSSNATSASATSASTMGVSTAGLGAGVDGSMLDDMNDLSLTNGNGHGNGQPQPQQDATAMMSNPFEFLYDEAPSNHSSSSNQPGAVNGSRPNSGNTNNNSTNNNSNNKFKVSSIFAKAKNQFERGVTNIAVQAQKATTGASTADIRDIITIGAYVQDPVSGEYNTCLGMTERVQMPHIPIPTTKEEDPLSMMTIDGTGIGGGGSGGVVGGVGGDYTQNNNSNQNGNEVLPDDGEGITFQIPILLPPQYVENDANGSLNIQFNIWMRSGAALFAKNRALRKYYSAGSAIVRIENLVKAISVQPSPPQQQQQQQQQTQSQYQFKLVDHPVQLNLPVQSVVINDGKLTMTVMGDTKFPSLCGNGWSMSDPRIDTAYTPSTGKKILFNPPLDQNYIFPVPKDAMNAKHSNNNTSSILVTTERTTESTVVLPLAVAYTELACKAANKSVNHAMELSSKLQCLDGASSINDPMKAMQLGHAQVQVEVLHLLRYNGSNGSLSELGSNTVNVMINLQRPDSIFENCIASGSVPSQPYIPNASYPENPAISVPFYPRVVLASDPRLLPGETMNNKNFHVGKLRFQLCEHGFGGPGVDVFSPIGPAGGVGTSPRHMEAIVDIDTYINNEHETLIQASVVDLKTGGAVGLLVLKIAANTLEGMVDRSTKDISSSTTGKRSVESSLVEGGLISFVGLDTLMEDDKACYPHSDLDSQAAKHVFSPVPPHASNAERVADRRKRQIATMGEFLSYLYMNNHTKGSRTVESKSIHEKFEAYKVGLFTPTADEEVSLTPDKRKDPRPFRPSSSRLEPVLSSIGFNIHAQNFCVTTVTTDGVTGKSVASPTALFKNVTCGAPADHFRGFGGKKNPSEPSISGGLRRLEATRLNAAQYVRETQDNLIGAIGNFYSAQSQSMNIHLPGRSARHISPSDHEMSARRTACIAATQKLHALTWDIAVRRASVFSQALGIAITLYLSHVSDTAKLQKGAWAELWKKHGFLISFEGLLSAAGKELGMIEDAAIGISMLRMASVTFVTEQSTVNKENSSSCIPVPDSPYIKWVRINPSGNGTRTRYLVEICVDANFYAQQIPKVLKNNVTVRFYPMLYEMGVDIRQWGSNATKFSNSNTSGQEDVDDDDEGGIPDNDVLIALNYEAFRKMNAYAHSVYRCNEEPSVTWEEAHLGQQIQQDIHPMLNSLYEFIKSSAGKMEHGILDEAAHAAAKLGGGAAIFCKSGKDRTAMQVTFKQSQFINRYLQTGGNGHADHCELEFKKVFRDATLMRVYGTRLPICDKNVGQSLYAFNSLQARFMPEVLKPPPRTLAGFLKGGRVFSREGGIES